MLILYRVNNTPKIGFVSFFEITCSVTEIPFGHLLRSRQTEYAELPRYKQPGNPQFTNGVNFASSGAGALVQTNQGKLIYFKNVQKLVKQQLGEKEAKKMLSRAVYLFNIGSNDYIVALLTNSNVFELKSREPYVEMVIGNITTAIKVMISLIH
ncbi:hypothetical protein U1Q18_026788 [Sarracenia purpurea var. burkii]